MLQGSTVKKLVAVLLVLAAPLLLLRAREDEKPGADQVRRAVAIIHPVGDSKVHGRVVFTQVGDEVTIRGRVRGLDPGKHAFHVHQYGDCSSNDGSSAGGHFNPDKKKHGGPHAEERHVGDLGNIEANDDGVATINIKDKVISLHGPHSIIGRAVIIHAKVDDLKTDPTGNAGGRIGCGVVGIANPMPPKKKS